MQNSFGKLANLFGNCNIHFYYGKMRLCFFWELFLILSKAWVIQREQVPELF